MEETSNKISDANLMYCTDCGKAISKNAEFCVNCGAPNPKKSNKTSQTTDNRFLSTILLC